MTHQFLITFLDRGLPSHSAAVVAADLSRHECHLAGVRIESVMPWQRQELASHERVLRDPAHRYHYVVDVPADPVVPGPETELTVRASKSRDIQS